MTQRTRRVVVLLLGAALIALLLLAVSLTDLHFQSGSPFAGASGDGAVPAATAAASGSGSTGSLAVLEALLGVLVLVFVVYLPSRLAGLLNIRNVLWVLLGLFLLVMLLGLLPRVLPGLEVAPPGDTTSAATPPSFTYEVTPLGSPPVEFRWLTAAGLVLGVVLIAFLVFRRASKASAAADALRDEAQKALDELRSGKDFQDVVIRCYLQMTEVLRTEQNIERRQSMTAREFEDWLESKGIPPEPVQRLTALFETVRYGNGRLTAQDEQAGMDCLTQITQHLRMESRAT